MELFRAIHKLGKPLVVFVMNAGPLDLAEIKASGVPIIAAGYGGEYGGQATADVLVEREKIVTQVETTLGELTEVFSELAGLVSSQEEGINHISASIENTAAQTTRANSELKLASRYQARARSRQCCLYVAAFVGALILIAIITVKLG